MMYDLNTDMTHHQQDGTPASKAGGIIDRYGALLALAAIGVLFAVQFKYLPKPRMDFYNELWAPAHLLVNGQSPYDTSSLDTNLPPAWFPMVIGFFFPLGWLPEEIALKTWFIFNIVVLSSIVLISQKGRWTVLNTTLLGIIFFVFPPTLNHLLLGQVAVLVTLCLLLAFHLMLQGHHWAASFLLALALAKPHLAMLAVLGMSWHYYRGYELKGMFAFWGRTAIVSIGLCIPLFIAYPAWIPDAIQSMLQNPAWSYPSLFVLFRRVDETLGTVLWGVSSLLVLWFASRLWKNQPPRQAFYWSLALTPLISPYIGSWDFVILLPMLGLAFTSIDWKRKGILLVSYVIAWVIMADIQAQEVSHNHYFWWVPIWFIVISTLLMDWKPVQKTQAPPGNPG
jgi:hypothetical protein